MKSFLYPVIVVMLMHTACNPENQKACWQGFDPAGGDIPGLVLCEKTRAEAEALHPQSWFYKVGERKFCWQVQTGTDTLYMRHIPESMVDRMRPRGGYIYNTVDCNSFCIWEWIEKVQHKPSGLNDQSRYGWVTLKADSCSKIFMGRVIITRETPDSIYRREFISKQP